MSDETATVPLTDEVAPTLEEVLRKTLHAQLEQAATLEAELSALKARQEEVERAAQQQVQQILMQRQEKSAEWLRISGGIEALRAVLPPDAAGAE